MKSSSSQSPNISAYIKSSSIPMSSQKSDTPPYRQIRAQFDDNSITVYQAYSAEIATAAVKHQKLNASPAFSLTRMTWIKPSWAWMLYRSGYSYKDSRQSRILALKVNHLAFQALLRKAVIAHENSETTASGDRKKTNIESSSDSARVRVQWDPERTFRLERLDYRSIQIGIPGALVSDFVAGIVAIEDVTEAARELKGILDKEDENKVTLQELVEKGLMPPEKEYEVDRNLRMILLMDIS